MNLFRRSRDPRIRVSLFGKTDVGRTREHNEDTFLVADLSTHRASLQPEVRDHEVGSKGSLFIVADGMGGAAAGEVASAMAAQTIHSHMAAHWVEDSDSSSQRFAYRLKEAVESANTKIHLYAKAHPELKGMGTTATAVGVLGDTLYLSQVGDSRAYLIRGPKRKLSAATGRTSSSRHWGLTSTCEWISRIRPCARATLSSCVPTG